MRKIQGKGLDVGFFYMQLQTDFYENLHKKLIFHLVANSSLLCTYFSLKETPLRGVFIEY